MLVLLVILYVNVIKQGLRKENAVDANRVKLSILAGLTTRSSTRAFHLIWAQFLCRNRERV
jgi:hypothetical protein